MQSAKQSSYQEVCIFAGIITDTSLRETSEILRPRQEAANLFSEAFHDGRAADLPIRTVSGAGAL